jgi:hypothetical protein
MKISVNIIPVKVANYTFFIVSNANMVVVSTYDFVVLVGLLDVGP